MKTLLREDTLEKEEWYKVDYILDAGAFYIQTKNRLEIPIQNLAGWLFDADRPVPLNIATLSLPLHHEITHGFDNIGSSYDHKG